MQATSTGSPSPPRGDTHARMLLAHAVVAGVAATLIMDLSNLLWAPLGVHGLDPVSFGKWLGALSEGRLVSRDLSAVSASSPPLVVALLVHYGIGVALAGAFVVLLRRLPRASARPLLAGIAFGVATSVLAWFLMFPSMGFGLLGLRPPEGVSLLGSSLLRHLAYGFGLGLVARIWQVRR